MVTPSDTTYGSGEVERYAGVSQTVVRDWRRRGLLSTLGEEQNGRWRYTVRDLMSFAVIAQTTKSGLIDLPTAWEISAVMSDMVMERISGPSEDALGSSRYFFVWPRESSVGEDVSFGAADNDIDRAMAHSPSAVAACIDLDRIIDALPSALVRLVMQQHEAQV